MDFKTINKELELFFSKVQNCLLLHFAAFELHNAFLEKTHTSI